MHEEVLDSAGHPLLGAAAGAHRRSKRARRRARRQRCSALRGARREPPARARLRGHAQGERAARHVRFDVPWVAWGLPIPATPCSARGRHARGRRRARGDARGVALEAQPGPRRPRHCPAPPLHRRWCAGNARARARFTVSLPERCVPVDRLASGRRERRRCDPGHRAPGGLAETRGPHCAASSDSRRPPRYRRGAPAILRCLVPEFRFRTPRRPAGRHVSEHGASVSADGRWWSARAARLRVLEAFRWDAVNGMVGLGDLPGGVVPATRRASPPTAA